MIKVSYESDLCFKDTCPHTLTREKSGLFSVTVENVPCGYSEFTCAKSVQIFVGKYVFLLFSIMMFRMLILKIVFCSGFCYFCFLLLFSFSKQTEVKCQKVDMQKGYILKEASLLDQVFDKVFRFWFGSTSYQSNFNFKLVFKTFPLDVWLWKSSR